MNKRISITINGHGTKLSNNKKLKYFNNKDQMISKEINIVVRILWSGGVQRVAFEETKNLSNLGFRTELCFLRKALDYDKLATAYDIDYKLFNRVGTSVFSKILALITAHYSNGRGNYATVDLDRILEYEIIRKKYDYVIYFDQYASIFSFFFTKIRGEKKIVYVHETAFRETSILKKLIERISLFNSFKIITNSISNKEILEKAGYNNVLTLFPGLTIKENLPTFFERDNIALSVTKWDMGRHPEVFLEIAKYIKKGKIILAGGWTDTNYKINFQKSVVRLGLNNKLEVTDSISEESLLKLYSKAKVALRFGYNEKGPGMGALESISFGLPLIINNGIGIKEVLTKGVDCVIVDEKSSVVIAEYLDLFFSNSTEWEKYSYSALKKAKELSWETHKESWRKILYG